MEILNQENANTISVKEWALTVFLSSLPIVGFILLLVWAFSDNTNIHKKNWAKGKLLIYIIGLILAFMFFFFFGGWAMFTAFNN